MRSDVLLAGVAALLCVAGCAPFRVAGAPTFGKLRQVTVSDIEAAVAAYRRDSVAMHSASLVGQIEVMSRDVIRIYWSDASSGYTAMRRSGETWRTAEQMAIFREAPR
jgi:hypothetical protein